MKGLMAIVGVAIVAVIGYVYFAGGSVGSHDPGSVVNDPNQVFDKGGQVAGGVKDAAQPWWHALVTQPWFWQAVVVLIATGVVLLVWRGMNGKARGAIIAIGAAVAAVLAIRGAR